MAAAIQFRGMDDVLDAFAHRNVEAWSLFQGKQFLFRGMGSGELIPILERIARGSNVIYTLKVYEDLTDASSIKSNTPDDGSFNFKLHADDDGAGRGVNAYFDQRFKLIEEKIAGIGAVDDEPETFVDAIGRAVVDKVGTPGGLEELVSFIKGIFSPAQPVPAVEYGNAGFHNAPRPQTVGNVHTNTNNMSQTLEEQGARITAAVEILHANDPKIAEHLEKLAKMSQKDKGQFQFLISMLDKMK